MKTRDKPFFTDLTLFCVAFIWALNFSVIKASLEEIDPYSFNAIRFILAALFMWFVVLWRKKWFSVPKEDIVTLLMLGLVGNLLYQWLFIVGIDLTLSANAAVMLGTIPIWIAIISHFLKLEKMNAFKTAGVILAFAGVAAIIAGGDNPVSFESDTFKGDILIIIAAVTWAVYTIQSKKILDRYTPLQFSALMTTAGAVFLTLLAFSGKADTNWNAVSLPAFGGMLYSGLLAIGVAYLIWNNGLVKVGAVRTSMYQNLVPVLGLIFGVVLLNESLDWLQYTGSAIVVTGIILTRKG